MHFPLFVDLGDRPCLVVGGGEVGRRKKRVLEDFGARVTVSEHFTEDQVAGQALVVAATDDRAVNARVSACCRAKGIPVNVVDDPALCTFIFPSVFRKGPIVAAVSSGGTCPVATQIVRDRLAAVVSDRFAARAAELGAARARLKVSLPDPAARRDWLRKELESC